MNKLYFKNEDADMCYQKEYWIEYMKTEGLTEIEVMKAIPNKILDIFWCKQHCMCGDKSEKSCGKECKFYAPRNGESGCCKHYTTRVYFHGEKVTLKIK